MERTAGKTGKVTHFEDLIAWQKARELVREVYRLTKLPPFKKDYGLRNQIQRAAVSIMSNIAEGFERGGRAEFHNFLVIAKGSCAEVRSQAYIALDIGYITEQDFQEFDALAKEVSKIIGGLRSAVQRQRDIKRK